MSSSYFHFLVSIFITQYYFFTTLAQVNNYIIHMDPRVKPTAFSDHESWYHSTLQSALDNTAGSSELLYSYTHAINGFSATLTQSELDALKSSPGFLHFTLDRPVQLDTTHTSMFLGLVPESGAWPRSNYGSDVIVGMVDSGVWPESRSFKDDGFSEVPARWKGECESGTQFNSSMCNKKLIGARYFNKGLVAQNPNLTIAMNSARDTDGHGTHTSSTAAGNYVGGAGFFGYAQGTAVGMAPRARVAMYKAGWDEGSSLADLIAAIDQAIMDGVNVISLSLGIDVLRLDDDPIGIATFSAVEKGIFVSTSAGNAGSSLRTLHNGSPWVITVAAGTVDREYGGVVILGNDKSVKGLALYAGHPLGLSPMVFMDSCSDTKAIKGLGADKIVVCLDKNNTLPTQVYNVGQAKLAGSIFITNSIDLSLYLESSFPTVFINLQNGVDVLEYIKGTPSPKARMDFAITSLGTKPAPSVASYSSRGPSPSCPVVLKPDILAPGDFILASWPTKTPAFRLDYGPVFDDFNIISGTSMACPHVSGVAALIRGTHPEWSPAAIRSSLMTTSYLLDNSGEPIKDIGDNNNPATPLAIGAGHISPNKALDPGLVYDVGVQDYINLLCALNYTKKQLRFIIRTSDFNCSNPSRDLNYPSFIAFFNKNHSNPDTQITQEFWRTVTNVGPEKSTYTARIAPIDEVQVSVEPDKLTFTEKYQKLKYKVSIKGPKMLKNTVVYGSLSWVDSEEKYVVRSPIVATKLSSSM